MEKILDAIMSGADSATIGALSIPDNYRAAHILASEATMWEGVESEKKDPRKSVHVGDVATPELAPDEVYVAVMASSINFNTCLLYTSPSPRDRTRSRMPSSA